MNTKFIVLICLAAALTGGFLFASLKSQRTRNEIGQRTIEAFARWKQQFGKLYASPAENDFRLSVFSSQLDFVQKKNSEYESFAAKVGQKLTGPMFEMNMFGDLTNEEFGAAYTGALPTQTEYFEQPETDASFEIESAPQPSLGQAFTPRVRQQGSCGSCYAFSAIVEIERLGFNNQKQYFEFSQQEIVDCAPGTNGCQGGHPEYAYDYIRDRGIHTAQAYPYRSAKMNCQNTMAGAWRFGLGTSNFWGYTRKRSQQAANNGVMPVLMVYANGAFRYLSKTDEVYYAISSNECGSTITHAITQVAHYEGRVKVLNSWGPGWAAGGFKWITPCNDVDNFWGPGGRLVIPYGY